MTHRPIETITRDELKRKLDAGHDFKLVMTLHQFAFQAAHIPGSLHFPTINEMLEGLAVDDEIVVYCSDPACVASQFAYYGLTDGGYRNVRRYEGGLNDWSEAGYPLEGDQPG